MKSLDELYGELEEYKDFDIPGNIDKFLEASDSIFLHNDAKSIPVLLKYFSDDSDYDWIYEELYSSILCYNQEKAIPVLIASLKNFVNKSPEWCTTLFCVLFNSKIWTSVFKKNMHLANKKSLFKMFTLLEKAHPHHKELIAELRKELN